MNLRFLVFASLAIYGMMATIIRLEPPKETPFHTEDELESFRGGDIDLPTGLTGFFPGSGLCNNCHGLDTLGIASVTEEGDDINVVDDWRSSMMANAAKDPFWRAKVSHEILINPGLEEAIETTCTKCHAPMGHYAAILEGAESYSIDEMLADPVSMDGVSCAVCHTTSDENLGNTFSGEIDFDQSFTMYGPYESPLASPMIAETGFQPVYSEHINDAGICASCHTLVTGTVDLSGVPTGGTFVEQATYHEWLNSSYNADNITCQNCHMPRIDDLVRIASTSGVVPPRTPFALHEMAGANTFMLKLMRDNRETLGLKATEAQFDSTIAATMRMLQEKSLDIAIFSDSIGMSSDTAYFKVELTNKAGHKFPSGYPSRRAFVAFTVTNEDGDTLFSSGKLDENFEVVGHDSGIEPHYEVISAEDQVQIYEMHMADVEGNFTTVLERAAYHLKDNRLPPLGFTSENPAYDTTLIVGNALDDPNFNKTGSFEGTGKDLIFYNIPLNGYSGFIDAEITVYYQSLPPKWMEEIFEESTPEIDLFRTMYYNNDQSPVAVGSQSIEDIFIEESVGVENIDLERLIQIHPNPTGDGVIYIDLPSDNTSRTIELFDLSGKLLDSKQIINKTQVSFTLPETVGTYLIRIKSGDQVFVRKVIHL